VLDRRDRIWFADRIVRLGDPNDLRLEFSQTFRIVGGERRRAPATVEVARYIYQLYTPDGANFLGYHWHPEIGRPGPHLHVYVETPKIDLRHRHLSTGYVSPATFVRLLIEEFGVVPSRMDWDSKLPERE
jgi:hypothetical protein